MTDVKAEVIPPELWAQWAAQDAFESLEGVENMAGQAREAFGKFHAAWSVRYATLLADHEKSVKVADRLIGADRDLRLALQDIVYQAPPDLHDEECQVVGEDWRCIEGCRVRNGREALEKVRP